MRILALDMASRTGYAVIDSGKVIYSGVIDFTKKRGESNGILFLKFRSWLASNVHGLGPFRVVSYERAHFQGGAATEICVGLQTHAQCYAAESGADVATYHTGTIKKFLTGGGKASKEDMMLAITSRTGIVPKDDNEADAIAIALLAWSELGFNEVPTKEEDPF